MGKKFKDFSIKVIRKKVGLRFKTQGFFIPTISYGEAKKTREKKNQE